MGSPCRVKVVTDLDRNEDSLGTFPSGWRLAFAMRSPVSGRVALFCVFDRNAGFFRSSILRCFAMGSPCGSCVFFSLPIVTKSTWIADRYSFRMGSPSLGLLGAIFSASPRGVLVSSFGWPVCSVAEWVTHSVVVASGVDFVCVPLANEGVGLGPSSGPVASRPPLGIGLLRRPRGDAFHLGVSMRWSSTHGGLLAALPEVRLPGMGCWCPFRVPQILCLTPLPRLRS